MSEEMPPPELVWMGKKDPFRKFGKPLKEEGKLKSEIEPDGEGPYAVIQNDPVRVLSTVSRRGDLDAAKTRAVELARVNPVLRKLIDSGAEPRWITVNDGRNPGNVQVYDLRIGTAYTDYGIHGPHVGEES
jgi:hypothetical protein